MQDVKIVDSMLRVYTYLFTCCGLANPQLSSAVLRLANPQLSSDTPLPFRGHCTVLLAANAVQLIMTAAQLLSTSILVRRV